MTSVITVEIAGQRYPIRSSLDERYVAELAAYVDGKIRTASELAPSSDLQGLAVLVALNIADEYFRARDRHTAVDDDLQARTMRLERLVDDALGALKASG